MYHKRLLFPIHLTIKLNLLDLSNYSLLVEIDSCGTFVLHKPKFQFLHPSTFLSLSFFLSLPSPLFFLPFPLSLHYIMTDTPLETKEAPPIEVKEDTKQVDTSTTTTTSTTTDPIDTAGATTTTTTIPVTSTADKVVDDEEDEFADAVGERHDEDDDEDEDDEDEDEDDEGGQQAGNALGLSMVISALQGTVQQQQQKDVKPTTEDASDDKETKDEETSKADTEKADGLAIDTVTTTPAEEKSQPGSPIPGDIAVEESEDVSIATTTNNKKPDLSVQIDAVRKSLDLPADKNMADYVTPPTPGAAPSSSTEIPNELRDQEYSQTNTVLPGKIDLKSVSANTMGPREQEKYG